MMSRANNTKGEMSRHAVQKPKTTTKSHLRTCHGRNGTARRDDQDVEDEVVDDEVLRARVRQRIEQRVLDLQSVDAMPSTIKNPTETPFMASLHHDVVQTAAQILGRYLAASYQIEEPLELALVHRMLIKEVELQALQQKRTHTHS